MKKLLALIIFVLISALAAACVAENNASSPDEESSNIEYSPIENFTFDISSDDGYTVREYKGSDSIVKIPPEYNGLPVIAIAPYAFSDGNAQEVYLPKTITSIKDNAFDGNTKIYKVVLDDSLESIGNRAFFGCIALKDITIPNSVKKIGIEAFAYSGLESVSLPEGLETIPSCAFMYSKLKEINIPSGIKSIENSAFCYCENLSKITLNNGLENIGQSAFGGTAIHEITIPNTVTSINEAVFAGCASLTKVYFKGNAPQDYSTEETQAYVHGVDYTVYYSEGAEGFTSPEWCGYKAYKEGDEVSEEVIPPNTGTAVFDINVTTSGSFDDEASEIEGYVNFIDHGNIGQNWKIEITVSDNIKSFSFIELDSSIALRVGETLYFHRAWKYDEPLMLHTYINDVFYNRGLSYITGDGEVVYYGFSCNMNTGDVGYGEVGLLLGQIPVGTYEPEVTGTSYQWENDIFKTYFDTYVRDDHRIAWSHIGVSEGKYVSPDKNGYTKFDIYCVKRSYDQFCEYYAVPYGETQIETVYIFQFDDSMVPVWIKPAN